MGRKEKVGIDLGLKDAEKSTLLELARTTIECKLKGKDALEFTPDSNTLKENRGAFVSLHRHGNLRGCIGYITAEKPLYKTIQEMALSAAFHDPRFGPLKENEFDDLDIEISVLTPMQQISDINEIEVGKHGLMIVKDYLSGLLLPQVATDFGWDRETFLSHTCSKAGLPEEAWKDKDTKIYAFSADVF
jgi:AmmeMemoRadiSam system protein A